MAPVIEAAILGSFIFREAKFLDTAFNLGEIAAAAAIFAVVVNPLNADIFFLKHDSSTFRQSSNHICGSWKSQASSPLVKQHRA